MKKVWWICNSPKWCISHNYATKWGGIQKVRWSWWWQ